MGSHAVSCTSQFEIGCILQLADRLAGTAFMSGKHYNAECCLQVFDTWFLSPKLSCSHVAEQALKVSPCSPAAYIRTRHIQCCCLAYVMKPYTICRYGPDVGEAASDLSHAAVQGGMTYFTVTRMGVSAVAKRIAKRTAKGLVKNTVNNVRNYHSGGSNAPGTQDVNLQAGRGH